MGKKPALTILSAVTFLIGYDLCSLRKNTIFNIAVPLHGTVEGLVGVVFIGVAWGIWSMKRS